VGGEAQRDACGHGDGEVADPGHRQVGQDVLAPAEDLALVGVAHASEHVALLQHHALGLAGGARRVHEHRRALGYRPIDKIVAQIRFVAQASGTGLAQLLPRGQAIDLVVAETARVVVNDVPQRWRVLAQFQQLVDLLLVLGQRKARLRLAGEMEHLLGRGVRVDRHRIALERAGGQHAQVQANPVVAEHQHRVPGGETQLLETGRDGKHLVEHLLPGEFLPDAERLLAHGDLAPMAAGVDGQQPGQGGLRVQVPLPRRRRSVGKVFTLHAAAPFRDRLR